MSSLQLMSTQPPSQWLQEPLVVGSVNGITSLNSLVVTQGSLLTVLPNTILDNVTAASGTVGSVHGTYLGIPTLTASNTGVTTTTASTLTIAGAPIAGTNETIPTTYALNVLSGNAQFTGNINLGGLLNRTLPYSEFTAITQSALAAGAAQPYLWNPSPGMTVKGGVGGTWSNGGQTWTPGVIGMYYVIWTGYQSQTELVIFRNVAPTNLTQYNANNNTVGAVVGAGTPTPPYASVVGIFLSQSVTDSISFLIYSASALTPQQVRNFLKIITL